ncbi:hypothetical protein AVEN_214271-1 [Araneus ventricosus]|uniref:Uncharacterized protein n=1 Tax=Araneus ventricosus TaxID=182803 RepID=A0A4Y1ZRJ1_ARAVE|nr:hypothetical protein AVEN_214271-1 [Araneus ventricosus]
MVRSRQTKTNSRFLKKAIRRTHIPAEFLRADVDFVCDVGPVRLVEFRSAINSEQQMQITVTPTMGTRLNEDRSVIGNICSKTFLLTKSLHRLNKSLLPKMKSLEILKESLR